MPHLSYARCGSATFPRCPLNWTSCPLLWALHRTRALLGRARGSVVFRKVFGTQVWQLTVLHCTTQEVPSSGVQSPGGQQTAFSGKRTPSALQGPPQRWFSRLQQGHNTKPTQLELTGRRVLVVYLSFFLLPALLRKVWQHVASRQQVRASLRSHLLWGCLLIFPLKLMILHNFQAWLGWPKPANHD